MAYTASFHGVTPEALDTLKAVTEGFGFTATDTRLYNDDTDVAYSYDSATSALSVSVRRRPALVSHGYIYGMIADALVESGVTHTDALSL